MTACPTLSASPHPSGTKSASSEICRALRITSEFQKPNTRSRSSGCASAACHEPPIRKSGTRSIDSPRGPATQARSSGPCSRAARGGIFVSEARRGEREGRENRAPRTPVFFTTMGTPVSRENWKPATASPGSRTSIYRPRRWASSRTPSDRTHKI